MAYLPDNTLLTSITREFFLNVLFYGNRNKYLQKEYKQIEIQKSTCGNKKFTAIIANEAKELLKNYNPMEM